jgi:hypothetical protein
MSMVHLYICLILYSGIDTIPRSCVQKWQIHISYGKSSKPSIVIYTIRMSASQTNLIVLELSIMYPIILQDPCVHRQRRYTDFVTLLPAVPPGPLGSVKVIVFSAPDRMILTVIVVMLWDGSATVMVPSTSR